MIKKVEFLTPTEVIEKYPEVFQQFGWTAKHIGSFLKSRLLQGHFNAALRKSMIDEASVKRLIAYANEQIENQKVKNY
jgi:hypothetical protein